MGGLTSQSVINLLAPQSSSGANVTEDSAMGMAAVLACVRLLSDMVAKLPIELYQSTANGPTQQREHPAINLLSRQPSELHTSFELRKLMMTGKGLGGNGYARVFRDGFGDPRAIQWLEPYRVHPRLYRRPTGEMFVGYQVDEADEVLTRYDILHIRGESRDGVQGMSPVALMRESIGTGISQTSAAGSLMKNGTQFPGFLTSNVNLTEDQIKKARDEFNSKYAGSIKTGTVPVLNGQFDFKQTNGMSMVDAQFIESRRFELQEIARHYGIPPHLIGDTTASTTFGAGIQEQTLGFLNFSLDPHLTNFEETLNLTLLTTEEIRNGFYFRFDRDRLAGVSLSETAAYFQTMRNIGVYSVNDVRSKLDEPKIPSESGGDDYALPLNSAASKSGASEPKQEPEPAPAE